MKSSVYLIIVLSLFFNINLYSQCDSIEERIDNSELLTSLRNTSQAKSAEIQQRFYDQNYNDDELELFNDPDLFEAWEYLSETSHKDDLQMIYAFQFVAVQEDTTTLRNQGRTDTNSITVEELGLIRSWTGSLFEELSDYTRGLDYEVEPVAIKLIETLDKMDKFAGTVYRGATVPEHLANRYINGHTVTEDIFFATSEIRGQAISFLKADTNESLVFYEIDAIGRNGVDISRVSVAPGQEEVLFTPGTQFRVNSIRNARLVVSSDGSKVLQNSNQVNGSDIVKIVSMTELKSHTKEKQDYNSNTFRSFEN